MDESLHQQVTSIAQRLFGDKTRLQACRSLSGGCISQAWICDLTGSTDQPSNGQMFVKVNNAAFIDAFIAEHQGLTDLANVGVIRIPECYAAEVCGEWAILICEAIRAQEPNADFDTRFGAALATHHRRSLDSAPTRYGYHRDNRLGSAMQHNRWSDNWCEFFCKHRLGYQLDWARRTRSGSHRLHQTIERVIEATTDLLAGQNEPPVLIHGDLWKGNILCDADHQPVLIDPAVYYAPREAELGMLLWLGGCTPGFYEAYQQQWPMADGWQKRVGLYTLYHQFNHVNLFGSGYEAACLSTAKTLLA